jgi:hypothetical protein
MLVIWRKFWRGNIRLDKEILLTIAKEKGLLFDQGILMGPLEEVIDKIFRLAIVFRLE